jgi:hypothetical protein
MPPPYVILGLWVLMADAWFQGPLTGRWLAPMAAFPLLVALLAAAGWGRLQRPER